MVEILCVFALKLLPQRTRCKPILDSHQESGCRPSQLHRVYATIYMVGCIGLDIVLNLALLAPKRHEYDIGCKAYT